MRINKYLAACGILSRRKSEELILSGKVMVNGEVVNSLTTKIDEHNDIVTVNGQAVVKPSENVYIILNKPKGCVCTEKDEHNRKTIFDFLPKNKTYGRLYCALGLDYDAEGLVLITNDGNFRAKITNKNSKIESFYVCNIKSHLTNVDIKNVSRFLNEKNKDAKVIIKIIYINDKEQISRLEITATNCSSQNIREGFKEFNKDVVLLIRKKIGAINLGGLSRGECKNLNVKDAAFFKKI